jgi:hypothetical protein
MWQRVEEAVHDTVVPPSEAAFDLTYENMRLMIGWKERLEELSQEAAEVGFSVKFITREPIKRISVVLQLRFPVNLVIGGELGAKSKIRNNSLGTAHC